MTDMDIKRATTMHSYCAGVSALLSFFSCLLSSYVEKSLWLICVVDIIASGIQQEQNSESTDVDEPFSPSTKETFDIDSTSPQTFSAMSDSAQSDRQHGTLSAETAAVDSTAEVDLVDSGSASLLLQSLDVTTAEEAADKVDEPTVMEPPLTEADSTGDMSQLKDEEEVKGDASVDDKSSEDHLQSDKKSGQDVVAEETLDVTASCDDDKPSEDSAIHLQSASEQEPDASGSVDVESDKVTEISIKQSSSADGEAVDSDVTFRPLIDVESSDVDTGGQHATVDEPSDSRTTRDHEEKTEEEAEEKVHYAAEEEFSDQENIHIQQTSEEHTVDVTDVEGDKELLDADQRKHAEVVISISTCSSVNAEDDDDLPTIEDTSIPATGFEEDSSRKGKVEETESFSAAESSTYSVTISDAEVSRTVHQELEQLTGYETEPDATGGISDDRAESLLLRDTERDNIMTDSESQKEQETEVTEPATPEVERNLSQYHLPREKETQEMSFTVVHEKHERKELSEFLTEAQQLHDTKLLCSSSESMVSSTTSDWTVIDTREEVETANSLAATVSVERDAKDSQQPRADELSTSTALTQTELEESSHDVLEAAVSGDLDESVEDDGDETDVVEDYLTATVTPTVDLMVMSTVLESILEEEERTSSSQKTTSSSEKLEHDVSDSSKLLGSSSDMQQAAESPTFPPAGKSTGGKSSDRDDVSVSSSLAEFERLERELQEKGSSDSFSGDKGSSESASAAALPESPQRKSSTSLSSSLAEFERIEHDILGQSGSLELITVERKSHHTDSSSFSELERIEEMDKSGATAEEQFRSSSASLAEFEYIEQQLRLNEELESEALKVATMLEKGRTSSAEKSPEAGSSQSDVRLSKEQIPESVESLSAEEIAQPAASADAQYPHYQDIVHIIREASKNVDTFQFGDHETTHTTTATETVSEVDSITRLRQEETVLESFHAETSSTKTTLLEDVSIRTSTDSVTRTEHVVVEHSDLGDKLELKKTSTESQADDLKSKEETDDVAKKELCESVVGSSVVDDVDLMMLSTDSLVVVHSDELMQLSTDSLQRDAVMTTSTDSLEVHDDTDVHRSSTSTLASVTTLLSAEGEEDEARCLMARSVDSLESDSREPSGEWVTVYEAESEQQHRQHTDDIMTESTDSLDAEFHAGTDRQLGADDAAAVSGSASYESFEADSLQDEVDEEPTLVSSQSQDSLLVAGAAATSMDISFGSSGAWSQSNVSSCTTLASSSDGEALTCSADLSTASGGAADRRLSEPSASIPLTGWSYSPAAVTLSVDNTATMLDSEGNILIAALPDEPLTPRVDDVDVGLDNRQSSVFELTEKQFVSHTVDPQPRQPAADHGHHADQTKVTEASAPVDVPPGFVSSYLIHGQSSLNKYECTDVSQKIPLKFSGFSPKQLGIFCPNFTRLLHVPIYAQLQIFIQLSPTMTKLCHIKCDHPACVSADGGHFEHLMLVALNRA